VSQKLGAFRRNPNLNLSRLCHCSKANIYADDTHTITSTDRVELIYMRKKELLNISDWLRVRKLSVNPPKTTFNFIGHQRRIIEINKLPSIKLDPIYSALVQLLYRNRMWYGSAYRLHCSELSITLLALPTWTPSVPAKTM